jgi:hypothetical protein
MADSLHVIAAYAMIILEAVSTVSLFSLPAMAVFMSSVWRVDSVISVSEDLNECWCQTFAAFPNSGSSLDLHGSSLHLGSLSYSSFSLQYSALVRGQCCCSRRHTSGPAMHGSQIRLVFCFCVCVWILYNVLILSFPEGTRLKKRNSASMEHLILL